MKKKNFYKPIDVNIHKIKDKDLDKLELKGSIMSGLDYFDLLFSKETKYISLATLTRAKTVIEKELKNYYKIKDIDNKSTTINDFFDSDIKMIQGLFQIAQNKILECIKSNETITKGRLTELLCFGSRIALDVAKGYDFSKRDYNTHHTKELKALEFIYGTGQITITKTTDGKHFFMFIGGRSFDLKENVYNLLKEVFKDE